MIKKIKDFIEKNKTKTTTLLFAVGIICLLIGISYAFFNVNFLGERENQLVIGENLIFRYDETGDALNLTNDDIISDEDGKTKSKYFDFEITQQTETRTKTTYNIYLTKDPTSTLSDSNVKIYLTDQDNKVLKGITTIGNLTPHETYENSFNLYRKSITTVNNETVIHKYRLRVWIDESVSTTITEQDGVHSLETVDNTYKFTVNVEATGQTVYEEENGTNPPNAPELATNMIPVVYNESEDTWVKADSTNENNGWYNYDNKIWANAVTVTEKNGTRDDLVEAAVGTPIPMERINTMWVWIPRFNATDGGYYYCSYIENPSYEENSECYTKTKVIINETEKEKMIQGLYVYNLLFETGKTEEELKTTVDIAISENDISTLEKLQGEYGLIYRNQYLSDFITLSEDDEKQIRNSIGDDTIATEFIENNFIFPMLNSISTVTSNIFVPENDGLFMHMCKLEQKSVSECNSEIQQFNNYDNSKKMQFLSELSENSDANKYLDDKKTKLIFELTFDGNIVLSYKKYNGTGDINNPGAFNITFVNKETSAHDAFTFGDDNLSGIWMGKFETSNKILDVSKNNLSCYNETCERAKTIEILPNKQSLNNNNVSNIFYATRSMEQNGNLYGLVSSEIDTHMTKNNEWGAVVYLSQSIYGRCSSRLSCKEIGVNNNGYELFDSSYDSSSIKIGHYVQTGYGAPAGSDNEEDDDEYPYVTPQPYNTEQGMDASTTGNIYGVYDMNGGLFEYVMGVYTDGSKLWSGEDSLSLNSGFNGCVGVDCASEKKDGLAFPDSKYYNTYTTETDYTNAGLQHAMNETEGWYLNSGLYVGGNSPWFYRGNYYQKNDEYTGLFSYFSMNGVDSYTNGFRVILINS